MPGELNTYRCDLCDDEIRGDQRVACHNRRYYHIEHAPASWKEDHMSLSENPSYYPKEYYEKRETPRPELAIWVKVPLTAWEAAELFKGISKAGWDDAHMPGLAKDGLQKIVLRYGS